ncbi:D-2-hydroxyacid dehydrogenase [Moraxella sp.]|uniref:D-2-hydroxyacid dehydrogenase n=1 Tax=Moraxella sp. TaxID=479 RepID=UPI0026DCC99F|nr:D-2-hydroxyacid dehydrogenase [Moraxella sp.]MDO4894958.1 D-2-hydroxyacid dehydrogenase [Moraxella sp.]
MKAVFLDAGTFSPLVELVQPSGVSDYVVYPATADDQIIERCFDADIIITNKVVLTADIIHALPNLKLIQLTATGMNNVDAQACQERNIALYNVAGYSVETVPEHTFMLMLAVMRAIKHYHAKASDGSWQADGRFCLLDEPIFDLAGSTLGIVGAGSIGKKVGQIATAFGMKVLYAERAGQAPRAGYTAFDEVLANSDVLALHCPLTDETHHLINDDTIAKMHKKPLIINVARGGVVDGESIVRALNREQIFGYASDVFESEPFADDDPLLSVANHPRVLFTPHNAWGSVKAQTKLWQILCTQVEAFIAKQH